MRIIERKTAGGFQNEGQVARLDRPLDMALCTVIPKAGGMFSIQLPSVDWEDGLQAVYAFSYDGKAPGTGAMLPATMRVVPVLTDIESHCMEDADGTIAADCALRFEKGRSIDIQSDIHVELSGEEVARLNTYLAQWGRR